MMDIGIGGTMEPQSGESSKELTVREPTLTETLEGKRSRLTDELARIDEAIAALKANPEVERILNLIQRVRRI